MNERLINDAAKMMALTIYGLIASCFREEERDIAIDEFFLVCKSGLEAYEQQQGRMVYCWQPSRN